MESLPIEILLEIFYFLPYQDLIIVRRVCRGFNTIQDDEFWREKAFRDFNQSKKHFDHPLYPSRIRYFQLLSSKIYLRGSEYFCPISVCFARAANMDNFEDIHYLMNKGARNFDDVAYELAKNNCPSLFSFLKSDFLPSDSQESLRKAAIAGAARGAHVSLFTHLNTLVEDITMMNWILYEAAAGGCSDIVHMILDICDRSPRFRLSDYDSGLRGAAEGGHLKLIELFIELGATDFDGASTSAIERNHIDILKYLFSYPIDNPKQLYRHAAYIGNPEIINQLLELSIDVDWCSIFIGASEGGYLELIKCAIDHINSSPPNKFDFIPSDWRLEDIKEIEDGFNDLTCATNNIGTVYYHLINNCGLYYSTQSCTYKLYEYFVNSGARLYSVIVKSIIKQERCDILDIFIDLYKKYPHLAVAFDLKEIFDEILAVYNFDFFHRLMDFFRLIGAEISHRDFINYLTEKEMSMNRVRSIGH